jgi:putative hydrolase of HD superfamily
MNAKDVLNFLYELGTLRHSPRSGWTLINVPSSQIESVSDHSLRTAQLAYILAKMEGYDNPHEAVTAAVFHDAHEARVSDLHKVARRYVNVDEHGAAREQFARVGADELLELWSRVDNQTDTLGILVKDADWLECAVTAREYMEAGYAEAEDWVNNVEKVLKTKSAQKIMSDIRQSNPHEWWHGLKKIKELEDNE